MQIRHLDFALLDCYSLGDGFSFFARIVADEEVYKEDKVQIIKSDGRDYVAKTQGVVFNSDQKTTVKVEGLEDPKYGISRFLDILHKEQMPKTFATHDTSCHLFYAPKDAASFPTHTDPVDLIILCIHGKKTMEIDGVEVEIPFGAYVNIPANTPHRATNKYGSVMLSIGAETRIG